MATWAGLITHGGGCCLPSLTRTGVASGTAIEGSGWALSVSASVASSLTVDAGSACSATVVSPGTMA